MLFPIAVLRRRRRGAVALPCCEARAEKVEVEGEVCGSAGRGGEGILKGEVRGGEGGSRREPEEMPSPEVVGVSSFLCVCFSPFLVKTQRLL